MDSRAKELLKQSEHLFGKKKSFDSLCQEIADNFYPERADFTTQRNLGEEFASNLMTSYPVLARRDLGNAFASMLRRDKWFGISVGQEERIDNSGKKWLEWATCVQRRAMYDRSAMFRRATKEGDHDFAAFGQCVIQCSLNRNADGLLYRAWHLRDCAWTEGYDGRPNCIFRKWKPTVKQLHGYKNFKLDQKVKDKLEKDPLCEINCLHIVIESEYYNDAKIKTPYISIYVDVDNHHIMEEVGIYGREYVIPRWQTVSGSQYAYSPATVVALPDSRLIQSMTLALLEAGEKAANPPMLAVQEAIRSDVQLFAGGITWADAEYDERLGEVLRPISQDRGGLPLGLEMQQDTRAMIAEAFYLNKLTLPAAGDMTAYEVSQRIQEYIRQALPLFEPMEEEYNGALCEETFELLMRGGAFGNMRELPQSLRGQDIQFKFESPIADAVEREKGQKFREAAEMLAIATQMDQGAAVNFDVQTSFRDVLTGIGVPAKWVRDEEIVAEMVAQQQEAEAAQQQLMAMGQAAAVTEQVGAAGQAIQGMEDAA